jgi:hypothetical protein
MECDTKCSHKSISLALYKYAIAFYLELKTTFISKTMHGIHVVLFGIIFTVVINAAWVKLPISIDKDATELTRLAEKFWSLKPVVFQNNGPLVLCQFIDECCAIENRFQAVSSMVFSIINEHRNKYRYGRIINKCINSTDLKETSQSCPSLYKLLSPLITEQDKSVIMEYMRIVMNYFTELNNLIRYVDKSCNSEEIYALLCLSNTALVQTCVTKILEEIYDEDDYKIYPEFIVETKQTLIDLNQKLFPLFGTNTNTD